ncbi:MAG TPA: DEAD/DEAH box helicase family protein [Chloroflexota bacterium]|nr:DEAD/DEAH box helicase family protein [Chloroflexota bacterium]
MQATLDAAAVGDLSRVTLLDHYATNRNDLVAEFYSPCLAGAARYDRAVGYFRSTFFLLAAEPIAAFALRGGKIRLVCSPELVADDIEALAKGYAWRDAVGDALRRVIDDGLADPAGRPVVEFLATLVASGCLDVRVAFRVGDAKGIFHDKVGVFHDGNGNAVSFIGSINETKRAWDSTGNHESFDVFRSWRGEKSRVDRHAAYFEDLWESREAGLDIIAFPQVARDRLVAVANPEGIQAAFEKIRPTRRAKGRTPQKHQLDAIAAWKVNGRRGILEHATGSGKTFTAITAMREHLATGKPVLVLVPSELLLERGWYEEVRKELADLELRVLLAGGGHDSWRKPGVLAAYTAPTGGPRVVIATLQTASSDEFRVAVRAGAHLMVIADEVHRAGSPEFSKVLDVDAGARLGLSATPRRYGDPVGTARILGYFGPVLDPVFTLADAIAAGRLCHYAYHVHPVHLNDQEADQWRALTKQITREVAKARDKKTGAFVMTERIRMLLIRRARIVKGAAAKIPLALSVLRTHHEPGQRWLIYCDDQDQLGAVLALLRANGFDAHEYHRAMGGNADATLDYFERVGGVLVAIKCLDEGVDIPAVDHALVLASSRNPREFIQRRGRVLRTADDKYFAEIHDAVVLPPPADEGEPDATAILRGELARAAQFAASAHNDSVTFRIRQLAREHGIDPDGVVGEAGFEDDGGDA